MYLTKIEFICNAECRHKQGGCKKAKVDEKCRCYVHVQNALRNFQNKSVPYVMGLGRGTVL